MGSRHFPTWRWVYPVCSSNPPSLPILGNRLPGSPMGDYFWRRSAGNPGFREPGPSPTRAPHLCPAAHTVASGGPVPSSVPNYRGIDRLLQIH
ncbi:hypothetical protein OUZ56_007875 [Daphnia magna]|uniref:Uncharacterized protein n=1 Tax=Daphnia magna TaxID=35525 RepID=A0ABR0AB86_9CRUS|nr:hypothetical protein OUZ56_007875 [Daphnia magna]